MRVRSLTALVVSATSISAVGDSWYRVLVALTLPAMNATVEARVVVNCPYDDSFRPQFNAIVYTCVSAGFDPITAGSSGRTGQPRLERILAELNSCRYSVHDLSRCRGEGDENLARFNMPLELGMAMAIRGAPAVAGAHEYLVLVPEGAHLHHRYISDLGGLDPQTHDGTPQRIVTEVLAWLLTAAEAPAKIDPRGGHREAPGIR